METHKLFLTLVLFAFASPFSSAVAGGYPSLPQHNLDSHRSIASSVWTVKGDMVILETEERTMRSFGVREWKREGFPSPDEGDEVTLILDTGNTIIDLTEPGGKGGFFGNEVTGRIHRINGPMKWIVLEAEDGETYGYDLKDAAATKLNWIEKGRKVTLAMDGENRVMDVFHAE